MIKKAVLFERVGVQSTGCTPSRKFIFWCPKKYPVFFLRLTRSLFVYGSTGAPLKKCFHKINHNVISLCQEKNLFFWTQENE